MLEDLDDHRRIFDACPACRRGGDDLQGAAAVGAAFHVDIEDSFEQPGPAHAWYLSLTLGVIGLGSALCRSGSDYCATCRPLELLQPRSRMMGCSLLPMIPPFK